MWKLVILAVTQSAFLCGGQVLLKLGLAASGPFSWTWSFFKNQLTNWWFLFCGISFGVATVLAAALLRPLMPWLLSFAAGAMLYVVVEELVPQAHSRGGTCGFVLGFLVMMVLDVALG